LHVAKKSHHDRPLKHMTRINGKVGWPEGRPDYSDLHLEPLETPAGTLVLLHGANVHGSEPNVSEKSRHAYSMHVVEGGRGYTWLEDNWLQRRKDMPFEPLFDDVDPA
jgi:ectoine hydroxylase-related dioxygenase (phytanoyl-CoA dioxygenase family)